MSRDSREVEILPKISNRNIPECRCPPAESAGLWLRSLQADGDDHEFPEAWGSADATQDLDGTASGRQAQILLCGMMFAVRYDLTLVTSAASREVTVLAVLKAWVAGAEIRISNNRK